MPFFYNFRRMEYNSAKNIHWFPGHMKKAYVRIEEQVKFIDYVIIVLDARAPLVSSNDYLVKLFAGKPRIYILNKEDLADPVTTKEWMKHYNQENTRCISLKYTSNLKKIIEDHLTYLTEEKRLKNLKKGIKNSIFRGVVVGYPNVGKSTIINKLIGSRKLEVANRPGVTRNVNWVKISKNYFLMDTPGITTPRFEREEDSIKLALIGSIRQDILPFEKIINYALNFLKEYYPQDLLNYLREYIPPEKAKELNNVDIINRIAEKFIPLLPNGKLDREKAQTKFLNDLKNGVITRLCFDRPE